MLRVAVLSFLLVASLPAQVPEYLYLKMNSTGASTTTDKALPGMPGANPMLFGGAVWNSSSPFLGSACYKSSSIPVSNGADALHMQTPFNLSGDWTIETWLRYEGASIGYTGTLFGEDSLGPFALDRYPIFLGYGALAFEGPFGVIYPEGIADTGVWHHIALVHDSAALTLTPYWDGVEQEYWPLSAPITLNGTDADGFKVGNTDANAPWWGSIDEFRIWLHARTEAEIQANMFNQLTSWSDDLAVTAVTSPVYQIDSFQLATASEVVTAEIKNLGLNTIPASTPIALSYRVNGGAAVNETVTLATALTTGDAFIHSFAATADLSQAGPQVVEVTASWTNDLNPTNNSRTRSYGGGGNHHLINVFPWFEDFESVIYDASVIGPQNWTKELLANGNPVVRYGTFDPSSAHLQGYPPGDHTYGAVDEAGFAQLTSFSGNPGGLLTPPIDLRALSNPRLRCWIFAELRALPNALPTDLSVDIISLPSGTITLDVWGPQGGTLSDDWLEIQVDLTPFLGQLIQVRFRTLCLGPSGEILLDDVLVYDHPIGLGQAPRPNIAVMDLNNALSLGNNPVPMLETGPYFSRVSLGGVMNFSFEGFPNAPIVLLAGPQNVQVATYGSTIGQLDIGGSLDPVTGIPNGLAVIFNGHNLFGLDQFFRTTSSGTTALNFPVPNLPAGILTTFQAVVYDPSNGIPAITNAIQLEIQ